MEGSGRYVTCRLSDGRSLDYWEGGDPDGRGVLHHPGTPCTRAFGPLNHEDARRLGVRLVMLSRPGYGGSAIRAGAPSLLGTGQDTAELARLLDMDEYAVMGVSGGGPYAVATAVADPEGVRAVGVVAGVGPWPRLVPPDPDDEDDVEERRLLAMLDGGAVAEAWDGMLALVGRDVGRLAGRDGDALVDAFFGGAGMGPQAPDQRVLWAASLAEVVARPDGYALDGLAWGGSWDVEAGDVVAPTMLWYGDADVLCPPVHGEWYAGRIAGSELVIAPGEGHMEVCSDHFSEHTSALLERWRS